MQPPIDAVDCFRRFNRRGAGHWDATDCALFLQQALLHGRHTTTDKMASELLFSRFERDGRLGEVEFRRLWGAVAEPIMNPKAALVAVDVQNDFIDGSLAMSRCPAGQNGADVVPIINDLVREVPFAAVVYSKDWHPEDHISFHDNLHLYKDFLAEGDRDTISPFDTVRFSNGVRQTLWPRHCVRDTWGARLHRDLSVPEGALVVEKGTDRGVDSYSAFYDNAHQGRTGLEGALRERNVTMAVVCGLALDFCVGRTALDALSLGLSTVVVRDASRGTDEGGMAEMEAEIRSRHGVVVDSSEVKGIVEGRDVREEFVRVLLSKEAL